MATFLIIFGALVALDGCRSVRAADPVTIDVSDKADGEYPVVLVVKGGQVVDARPLKSIKLAGSPTNPNPPPNPPPGPEPTAFEAEVERQAKAAITAGGTLTTGAGFCEVFYMVAAGVADKSIDHTRSLEAVNLGTKFVLSKSADAAKWEPFERHVRNALQVLDAQGSLRTKEDYAGALTAVANGLSRATGHKPLGKTFLSLDFSTAAKTAATRKAHGILDGIDLQKLMEFIRFIVELFKLFAPM